MSADGWVGLPEPVSRFIDSCIHAEFATLTASGVPLDTPVFAFKAIGGTSIDIATGLAYPAKAERARNNSKVGLLLEGLPHEPVVSLAAFAAVRDADIQANVERYIAETIAYYEAYSQGNPWSVARAAVCYWPRIFVLCTPKRILWWPNAAAMDAPPQRWEAPPDTLYPKSDPAPAASPSAAPGWPLSDWRARAREMVSLGVNGHMTLTDSAGFPLPIRATSVTLVDDGFEVKVPAGAPWEPYGPASLCFIGTATFVGAARPRQGSIHFIVDRILPTLPMVKDFKEIWNPSADTYARLMARLRAELERRGLPMPQIPQQPPAPTEGSVRRSARMAIITAEAKLRENLLSN